MFVLFISYLLVLQVRELNQDLGGRVLHVEKLEDGGTIVGDRDILGGGAVSGPGPLQE